MIYLTQNDTEKTQFYLNHRDIRRIVKTFQTVIVMADKEKYIVVEEPEEIIKKIKEYESQILKMSYENEQTEE